MPPPPRSPGSRARRASDAVPVADGGRDFVFLDVDGPAVRVGARRRVVGAPFTHLWSGHCRTLDGFVVALAGAPCFLLMRYRRLSSSSRGLTRTCVAMNCCVPAFRFGRSSLGELRAAPIRLCQLCSALCRVLSRRLLETREQQAAVVDGAILHCKGS